MSKVFENLIGLRFGYLIVIKKKYSDTNYRTYWECLCDCGKTCSIRGDTLKSNQHVNCGCKSSELLSKSKIQPNKSANINRVFRQYKKRGIQSGKGFTLTREQFISFMQSNCYYCDSPPSNCVKIKTKAQIAELYYNGIDRIDSSKGYTIENCVSCCIICNFAKNDMSIVQFFDWIKKVHSKI